MRNRTHQLKLFTFNLAAVVLQSCCEFGERRAFLRAWRRTGRQVLRITVDENPEAMVIKLEGRLAGPWTAELDRLWEETAPSLAERKLSLDLRGTTFADAGGIKVLKAIYSQTRAAILTGTPWTQYLAEEIACKTAQQTELEG